MSCLWTYSTTGSQYAQVGMPRKMFFVIQIKRKLKRKRKRKRNGWRHLRGGASRPPRRFPRFRFRFRFRFNFHLIWITERNDCKLAHGPPPRTKNSVRKIMIKNKACLKRYISSWGFKRCKNRQNRSYPQLLLAVSKFTKKELCTLRAIFSEWSLKLCSSGPSDRYSV